MFTMPFLVWVAIFRTEDAPFLSALDPSWVGFTDEEAEILKGNTWDRLFAIVSS